MKNDDDDLSFKEIAKAGIATLKVILVACVIAAILLGLGSLFI